MKVYLIEPIHPLAYAYLSRYVEITQNLNECDGLICRNIQVDKGLMDLAPRLKVIGSHGTGVNDIDLEAARKRNILVYNCPDANSLSVAEMNVALMMNLTKNMKKAMNYYPDDKLAPVSLIGGEISNKVAGFIGLGNIAQKTAKMLHFGFDDKIIAYSRTPKNIDYITECRLEEVFLKSDFIFIGLALNESTREMINWKYLSLMKKGSYLINTARGQIIQEEDLLKALKEGIIAGYGADVFNNEPEVNPAFYQYNVIATPHIGASTDEALERVGMLCVKQMVDALMQKQIPFQIK